MTTIVDIELKAKAYAADREKLSAIATSLNDMIEAAKRQHLVALKRAVQRAAESEAILREAVTAAPQLFIKPKSKVFHGIKLGYQKGKGGIDFDDPERGIKLIRKHFPDQADILVQTKEKPAKEAIEQLSVEDLKKIGCTVRDTGDVVFVRAADSEVNKLVDALLKGVADDAAEDA